MLHTLGGRSTVVPMRIMVVIIRPAGVFIRKLFFILGVGSLCDSFCQRINSYLYVLTYDARRTFLQHFAEYTRGHFGPTLL